MQAAQMAACVTPAERRHGQEQAPGPQGAGTTSEQRHSAAGARGEKKQR